MGQLVLWYWLLLKNLNGGKKKLPPYKQQGGFQDRSARAIPRKLFLGHNKAYC